MQRLPHFGGCMADVAQVVAPGDLEHVIAAFRASLPRHLAASSFRLDHLDRIGVPVVQANLFLPDEPATTGHGYGATEAEAEAGAWGELCEELHVHDWLRRTPPFQASRAELVRTQGEAQVLDPLTLCLPAGSDYAPDLSLDWVRGQRLNGSPVWLPREWVAAYPYQMPNTTRLIMPITNGLGAGLSRAHAIAHGLMELLQRDGNVMTYRALDQGIVVKLDVVEPATAALVEHLHGLGIAVMVKLACTDFGLSNLYVVGDDHGEPMVPIQVTACGEAAHPDRDRALRKALLEFIGSRARKAATHGPLNLLRRSLPTDYVEPQIAAAMLGEDSVALAAMVEWLPRDTAELRRRLAGSVFSRNQEIAFSSLPTVAAAEIVDPEARLALLVARLAAEGLEVVLVDCSPPGSDVAVAKVVVPGLESETMSYHRIGWRGVRRLRERGDLLLLDTPRDGAARVRLRSQDEARAGGPAWFDTERARLLVGTLYPLYRESGVFSAQLQLERAGRG